MLFKKKKKRGNYIEYPGGYSEGLRIPEIGFSGKQNQPKNGFKSQVEQGFSSFFGIFDDFSKIRKVAFGALHPPL